VADGNEGGVTKRRPWEVDPDDVATVSNLKTTPRKEGRQGTRKIKIDGRTDSDGVHGNHDAAGGRAVDERTRERD
jgi:hypothetical protein